MRSNLGLDERTTGTGPRRNVDELKPRLNRSKSSGDRERKLGATARSFAILEHVASSRAPVDVLDIIASVKLPKATAYR
ncbi:MAG: helix-turn-helix domain-containing protein, partial [Pseudolabrys sp.]